MVALAENISADTMKAKFMPVLQQMYKDPVANVRLNVAKTLQALQKQVKSNKDNQVSLFKFQLPFACRTLLGRF